jgi:hypothetical protein
MGLSGLNPGLAHALTSDLASQERAAQDHQASAERVRLDTAELRELERAELRGEAPVTPERRRGLPDQLRRRGVR